MASIINASTTGAGGLISTADASGVLQLQTASTTVFELSGSTLKFNSGYGSVATAYGCRAWVNFNGQGTVSIRGSGNVSSITDNGVGDYTINFTIAMPDTNYNITGFSRREIAGFAALVLTAGSTDTKTTSSCQIRTGYNVAAGDQPENGISFFR